MAGTVDETVKIADAAIEAVAAVAISGAPAAASSVSRADDALLGDDGSAPAIQPAVPSANNTTSSAPQMRTVSGTGSTTAFGTEQEEAPRASGQGKRKVARRKPRLVTGAAPCSLVSGLSTLDTNAL